jgi:hypothetical protein
MRGWIRKALLVGGKRQVAGDIEERNPTIQIHLPGCQLYVRMGTDMRQRAMFDVVAEQLTARGKL